MNSGLFPPSGDDADVGDRAHTKRADNQFKKLKRPMHTTKRSKAPERLRGMHRRRRKRMGW